MCWKQSASLACCDAFITHVSTEELKMFVRLTGNRDVHDLSVSDICTTSAEISNFTVIEHV